MERLKKGQIWEFTEGDEKHRQKLIKLQRFTKSERKKGASDLALFYGGGKPALITDHDNLMDRVTNKTARRVTYSKK